MRPRDLRDRARALVREVQVVALAAGDRTAPLVARLLAVVVVAYALSPIDLIPDPIPVLGLLDDLVLVPLGIALVRRLLPHHVLQRARLRLSEGPIVDRRLRALGAVLVVTSWALVAVIAYRAVS